MFGVWLFGGFEFVCSLVQEPRLAFRAWRCWEIWVGGLCFIDSRKVPRVKIGGFGS